MELSCKLASNDTSNIGMISSDSKYVSIKISEQCLQIINNKDKLNVPEDSTKMQKIESLFKYQSRFYNI